MKTSKHNTSESLGLLKPALVFIVGGLLILSTAFSQKRIAGNGSALIKKVEWDVPLNKGVYLASEFLKFKNDNLRSDLYTEEKVSEKVLFKAFVRYKESMEGKKPVGVNQKQIR